jgi:hypothetical protein
MGPLKGQEPICVETCCRGDLHHALLENILTRSRFSSFDLKKLVIVGIPILAAALLIYLLFAL